MGNNRRVKVPGSLICRYCETRYIVEIAPLSDVIKKNRCPCCSQKMALVQPMEMIVNRIG